MYISETFSHFCEYDHKIKKFYGKINANINMNDNKQLKHFCTSVTRNK
jgi:hypothetical protein